MTRLLEKKFEKHVLKAVGRTPNRKELLRVNKITKREYKKIYGKPNRPLSVTRASYDNVLSKIWPAIVATTSSPEEVMLLCRYVKFQPGYRVTSVASGLCVFEIFLAKELVPRGKVCCIDLSEEMNKQAKAFARKFKQHNIKVITASATKLPLASNSQDVVLARRSGMSNDKRWVTVLKEAVRVLKKSRDSRFVYTVTADFNKPTQAIKEDLRKAGLSFIAIEKFGVKENAASFMIVAKLAN